MLIHTKDIRLKYTHYALLIDKKKGIPVKISGKPVIEGGKDGLPNVVYVSSICILEDALYIFMGYDDRKCVASRMNLACLSNSFASISC